MIHNENPFLSWLVCSLKPSQTTQSNNLKDNDVYDLMITYFESKHKTKFKINLDKYEYISDFKNKMHLTKDNYEYII